MAKPNPPTPLIMQTPGPASRVTFQLVFPVGVVVRCPSYRVPPGATVVITPINGLRVNAEPCFIAERASLVETSSGSVLPAGSDVSIQWMTDDTGKIFAKGTLADGILITVNEPGVG